jgi:ABC-2 type transport system ATP-binding protein
MMNLVQAAHVVKTFSRISAVDNLSLSIPPGEIYGLVGSDGAGKTTTLRLLVGALKPDSGEIVVCGHDLRTQVEKARARVGYLSQRFSLYEDLTVLENIRFFAELRGLTRKEWLPRCLEILDFVGLSDFSDRRAGQLSGGMKQKLGLASALVTRPQVLLLDEPTTGVDPVTRQDFWQLVIKLVAPVSADDAAGNQESQRTVILTTPYMDEASRCHRVGFMSRGRIIAEGTPSTLRARLEDRILEVRGSDLPGLRLAAGTTAGVEDVRAFGDRLHLRVNPGTAKAVIQALSSAYANQDQRLQIRQVTPTLEDVFIDLAG